MIRFCLQICLHACTQETLVKCCIRYFCRENYRSVAIVSALEESIEFPMCISCISAVSILVYKRLMVAIISLCLLADLVVVVHDGRRWHKYVAVGCILLSVLLCLILHESS